MKLGVIDIGTNSIHLILVEIKADLHIEVLDKAKEFCRLGEHTFRNNHLSEEAIERGIAALKRFKRLAEIRGVSKLKAVATSAVREADNGGDFLNLIEETLNIPVKVITGQEEARLIHLAVTHAIPMDKSSVVIVDIGGGSVECIICNNKQVFASHSFKLGAIRLKEGFIFSDPPQKSELEKLHKHIQKQLNPLFKELKKYKVKKLIGSSGSILNLASIAHALKSGKTIQNINNYKIELEALKPVYSLLEKSDAKARKKIKGLDIERQDIILPAASVIQSLHKNAKLKELVICNEAIREGMVYDYMAKNKNKIELEALIPDLRQRSVLKLAQKCQYRTEHANQVAKLCLKLFDYTQKLHQLKKQDRELIYYTCILHDIGHHISYKRHHKHSHYLIKNGNLKGFEENEIAIMASIARAHYKSFPKNDEEALFTEKDNYLVKLGSALLRIADGLDRSHFSLVENIKMRTFKNTLHIHLICKSDPELEIWAAQKKSDLFEQIFSMPIKFSFEILPEKSQN